MSGHTSISLGKKTCTIMTKDKMTCYFKLPKHPSLFFYFLSHCCVFALSRESIKLRQHSAKNFIENKDTMFLILSMWSVYSLISLTSISLFDSGSKCFFQNGQAPNFWLLMEWCYPYPFSSDYELKIEFYVTIDKMKCCLMWQTVLSPIFFTCEPPIAFFGQLKSLKWILYFANIWIITKTPWFKDQYVNCLILY